MKSETDLIMQPRNRKKYIFLLRYLDYTIRPRKSREIETLEKHKSI